MVRPHCWRHHTLRLQHKKKSVLDGTGNSPLLADFMVLEGATQAPLHAAILFCQIRCVCGTTMAKLWMGKDKNYILCGIDWHLPAPSLKFIYLLKLPNFFIIKASPYEIAACLNSSLRLPEVLYIFGRDAAQVVLPAEHCCPWDKLWDSVL